LTYGYIRVSTDKQTVENQRFEISRLCEKNNLHIDSWIEETASGTIAPQKRRLGRLLGTIKSGDLVVCSELSRLGRSLFMIMSILNQLMVIGAKVWTVKDNYRLGDDIQSKVLAFAFGLSAEIERNLISQRTKEALALRKAEGITLGRPAGSISAHSILDGAKDGLSFMLYIGTPIARIAHLYGVHRNTVNLFIARKKLHFPRNMKRISRMTAGNRMKS
jgi:DNA invertase Pin-like site-specific DNA recombinase